MYIKIDEKDNETRFFQNSGHFHKSKQSLKLAARLIYKIE